MSDYLNKESGEEIAKTAAETSAGAGDAGKIPKLDASGKLDQSLFPSGVVDQVDSIVCSEDVDADELVSLFDDAGTTKWRLADATDNTKPADGIVLTSATAGNAPKVLLFKGRVTTSLTMTKLTKQYLSAATPGALTETPPSASGNIIQPVGLSESTTVLQFKADRNKYTVIE